MSSEKENVFLIASNCLENTSAGRKLAFVLQVEGESSNSKNGDTLWR